MPDDNGRSALLRQHNFIAGSWREAHGGARHAVFDPATLQRIAEVPDSGADDARDALEAAKPVAGA